MNTCYDKVMLLKCFHVYVVVIVLGFKGSEGSTK